MAAFGASSKRSSIGKSAGVPKKRTSCAFNREDGIGSAVEPRASVKEAEDKVNHSVSSPEQPTRAPSAEVVPEVASDVTDNRKSEIDQIDESAAMNELFETTPSTNNFGDGVSQPTEQDEQEGLEDKDEEPKGKKVSKSEAKPFKPLDPSIENDSAKKLHPDTELKDIVIVGTDEAGRGPLVGPVVCAAAYWVNGAKTDHLRICDSKALTREEARNEVHDDILSTPGLLYSVVEISPQTIEKVNILNCSLLGMSLATSAVLDLLKSLCPDMFPQETNSTVSPMIPLCEGINVQTGFSEGTHELFEETSAPESLKVSMLCDGDKIPYGVREGTGLEFKLIPEETGYIPPHGWLTNQWKARNVDLKATSCIKGDASHRSIATASILAKVARDQLMRQTVAPTCLVPGTVWGTFNYTRCENSDQITHYFTNEFKIEDDVESDPYGLATNKGYPTKVQKEFLNTYGASIHHRLSFKPTCELLLNNQLKMPIELGDRALEYLQEEARRSTLLQENKKLGTKKRSRMSATNEISTSKKSKLGNQITLDAMFKKK